MLRDGRREMTVEDDGGVQRSAEHDHHAVPPLTIARIESLLGFGRGGSWGVDKEGVKRGGY